MKLIDDKMCTFEDVYALYKGLVFKHAISFKTLADELEDLVQIGYMALYKAYTKYDAKKKVKFSTYATQVIRRELMHRARDMARDKRKINMALIPIGCIKLGDDEYLTFEDIQDSGVDVEDCAITSIIFKSVFDSLNVNQKRVLKMLIKHNGNQSQAAKELNVSQASIWQTKEKIRTKFQKAGVI